MKNAGTRVYVKDNVAYVKEGILKKKDSLIEAEIPEGTLQIAEKAFLGCTNLEYVSIPDSVIEIGEQAFLGCENLSSANLDHMQKIGNEAFYNCKNLNYISLDDLSQLGEEAFVNTAVERVNIPDKMKEKGVFAFVDAFEGTPYYDSMERVELHDISEMTRELYMEKNYCYDKWISGLVSVSPLAFVTDNNETKRHLLDTLYSDLGMWDAIYYGNTDEGMYYAICSDNTAAFLFKDREMSKVEIPGYLYTDQEVYTVRRIVRGSLLGSTDVEEIVMPDQLWLIGSDSLLGTSIKKIEKFPNSLITLGNSSLPVLTEQTELILPYGLEKIGEYNFRSLPVEEVKLPSSLTEIGEQAFRDSSLRSVEIPDSVEVIGETAFINCSNLTEVKLPNNEKLTEIPSFSFRNCTSLETLEIPDHITAVGEAAFAECTSLTTVTIPDSVTKLGKSAFEGCTSLITVNIPDHVMIGEDAFRDCTSLSNTKLLGAQTDNKEDDPEFDDFSDYEEDEPELDEQVMVVMKCNESITLRTSPSTAAAEICQIPLGDQVNYIEDAGEGFYRVEYNGETGYALAEYLGKRYERRGAAGMVVTNCNESITLRKKPSTSAEEICQIPLGEYVDCLADAGEDFWMVEYEEEIGYALKNYLEPVG